MSWAYNPWLEQCRTSRWTRECKEPPRDAGWGFFQMHGGQISAPYVPGPSSKESEECASHDGVSQAEATHILLVRIVSSRLDNATLFERASRLEPMIEPLLGFPAQLLSIEAAASVEQPSDLLPAGVLGLFSLSQQKFFGLDPTGRWKVEQVVRENRKRHLMEVFDAGNGNVALRSAVAPWYFLRASRWNSTLILCQAAQQPDADSMRGFRFRAKAATTEAGETGFAIVSVDYGVVLRASSEGDCLFSREWPGPDVNLSAQEVFHITAEGEAEADAPQMHTSGIRTMVDQDGVPLGAVNGVSVTAEAVTVPAHTDSATWDWLEAPIKWISVDNMAQANTNLLQFGVWEKPTYDFPDDLPDDGGLSDPGIDSGNLTDHEYLTWEEWLRSQGDDSGVSSNRSGRGQAFSAEESLGPFDPLPTWLGVLLLSVTCLVFAGFTAMMLRSVLRAEDTPGAPPMKRWRPAAIANAPSWAPRKQGQSLAAPQVAPAPSSEAVLMDDNDGRAAKIRILASKEGTHVALDAWMGNQQLAASDPQLPEGPKLNGTSSAHKMSATWSGSFRESIQGSQPPSPLRQRGTSTALEEDDPLNSTTTSATGRSFRRSSLSFAGPRTSALVQSPEAESTQPEGRSHWSLDTDQSLPKKSDDPEKQAEREARQERVRVAVRAVRDAMKNDRVAGVSKEARLDRLQRWRDDWDPSRNKDKICSSVMTFLDEAEDWYLKDAQSKS